MNAPKDLHTIGTTASSSAAGAALIARLAAALGIGSLCAGIGDETEAVPHRGSGAETCLRAAESHMGVELGAVSVASERETQDGAARRLVYVDASDTRARLPGSLRLYCTLDADGRVEHLVSMPRLPLVAR